MTFPNPHGIMSLHPTIKMDGPGFLNLPEECVSAILSFTTPRDTCRSSSVAKVFQSIAESDSVWEKFLPSDYEEILKRADSVVEFSSKKELYFRLCDPILVDDGKMSFVLNKPTGKTCYMVAASEFGMAQKFTDKYWRRKPLPESRFAKVAKLKKVWSFHIQGHLDTRMLSPRTTYAAYLVVRFKHAWPIGPAQANVKLKVKIKEQESKNIALLHPDNNMIDRWNWDAQDFEQVKVPHNRDDGWMEVELGDFYNNGDEGEVMMEINNYDAEVMVGVIIEGIEVRPKE